MASLIEIDWKPTRRTLRNFGLIALVAFGIFGALARSQIHPFKSLSDVAAARTAMTLFALAGYCGFFALVAPMAVKPIYLLMTVITYPIGFVMSYVVMAIMYYGVITPVGVIFKIIGRDAMHRKFDPSAETYWIKRRPPDSVKRYFRQF
jgi:hypothetical protein